MISKETVLNKYTFLENISHFQKESIERAMSEYAEQVAIEFDKWKFNEKYWWHERKQKFVASWDNYAEYTYKELFDKFKKENNIQ